MRELQVLQEDIREWSDNQFGHGRNALPMLKHLELEVKELEKAIIKANDCITNPLAGVLKYERLRKKAKDEFADCFMLILDAASHFRVGIEELTDITREKLEVNKKRKWGTPNSDGVCQHIRV